MNHTLDDLSLAPRPRGRWLKPWELLFPLGLAGGAIGLLLSPTSGTLGNCAWSFSTTAFVYVLVAALLSTRVPIPAGSFDRWREVGGLSFDLALLLSVAAGILQVFFLCTRAICVAVDVANGFPWRWTDQIDFPPGGLWTQGVIFLTASIGLLATGNRRLFTCTLWSAAGTALWAVLLIPAFELSPTGVVRRTSSIQWVLISLAVLLTVAALVGGSMERQIRESERGQPNPDDRDRSWPGFYTSCTALSLMLILLTAYQLAVPAPFTSSRFQWGGLLVAVAGTTAAVACVRLGIPNRIGGLVDAGLGLFTLAACALPTCVVASPATALADLYPQQYNALLFGCTLAFAGLTQATWHCRRNSVPHAPNSTLRWLTPRLRRGTFMSAALALVFATMLIAWPRLPAIAATDDSLSRFLFGFLAHISLLFVSAWSALRLRGWSLHMVTVLALGATIGFVWSRLLPFTPWLW